MTVIRHEATVDVSEQAFFTSARIAIRAVARVGCGFVHAGTVAKVLVS